MRSKGKDVDIIRVLASVPGRTTPGTLQQRIRDQVMIAALELDAFGKLNRKPGKRTIAQILLESLLGTAEPLPEEGWEEDPFADFEPLEGNGL